MKLPLRAYGDPYQPVERVLGRRNFGCYCVSCDEFVALAVPPDFIVCQEVEVEAEGPVLVECNFCHQVQGLRPQDFRYLTLDEPLLRRSSRVV